MPETSKSNTVEIGKYGVVPPLESTVLTVGGKSWVGLSVALLHAVTWIVAAVVIAAGANGKLATLTNVTPEAHNVSHVYAWFPLPIVAVVLIHAMLAKKEETLSSSIASIVLFTLVLFELSLGGAYIAYSLSTANTELYNWAIVSHLLVCAGCAMILTFYVNFTHNGNLTQTVLG